MPPAPAPNRRADAQRSRAAILEAAIRLLPEARMDAVAAEAGVTRQTVYAHFPSRSQLHSAVLDRITEEALAAMDAADLDSGPAADALLRLVDAAARTLGRYPQLALWSDTTSEGERHAPVAERLRRVISRGQRDGEFDDALSTDWLVSVVIAVGHAEADLGEEETHRSRRTTLLRVVGHQRHL
ncbi:TetR/AcrR family transcriptional regulator [Nocardiopsis sp. B62]|uniref:TetR/AcrR family transcriptional regulator n=1 Tax=Nocardiopsis sp. B62 TaxID=2824874 RepID=UPI001B38B0BE|nr:TetR family transcriptional regulator [Nocardiopsis sp. B62]MBQ1082845.1 TetR/AcrR family transcriptional regulator [Nocardiopsis sp. B62]